jgi:chaperonin GroEL
VIVAEDVDGDAITNLVLNKLRCNLKVCCVKSPGFGDNRRNTMQDIALATGAQFISEDVGLDIEEVDLDVLGSADTVIISKDDTIIMGGKGETADIEQRVEMIE